MTIRMRKKFSNKFLQKFLLVLFFILCIELFMFTQNFNITERNDLSNLMTSISNWTFTKYKTLLDYQRSLMKHKSENDITTNNDNIFNPDLSFRAMQVPDIPTKNPYDEELMYDTSTPSDYNLVESLVNCAFLDSNDKCDWLKASMFFNYRVYTRFRRTSYMYRLTTIVWLLSLWSNVSNCYLRHK